MKNFTLCYYENPGALIEIKHWEQLKFDRIVNKQIWTGGIRLYSLDLNKEKCNGYSQEIMICIPIDLANLYDDKKIKIIIAEYHAQNGTMDICDYYKTIIFGKISADMLLKISTIIKGFEK